MSRLFIIRRLLKKTLLFGTALTCFFLLFGCSAPIRYLPQDCVNRSGQIPTLQQKIAQMLIIGFRATELKGDEPIVRDICKYGIGGVILFDYDVILESYERCIVSPQQLFELTRTLHSYSELPLLIAIDQEGGRVSRLKERYGFPSTVSAQYLGSANDLVLTRKYAESMAETLRQNGINVNFAPVVDLNVNPDNPVIGGLERSFSADPAVVAAHAGVFVEAHKRYGIMTSLKHFPGHGSSNTDSHKGLVDVTSTWNERELEPYRNLLSRGDCKMVMTAHIFNSNLDPEYPATLSYATITGLLRNKLGFKGVVVSDDMQMGAITQNYSFDTAIEKAILAGVDILDVANEAAYDPDAAQRTIELVTSLVKKGVISEKRINESFERIMELKRLMNEKKI